MVSISCTVRLTSANEAVGTPSGGPETTKIALGLRYFSFRLRLPRICKQVYEKKKNLEDLKPYKRNSSMGQP